MEEPEIKNPDVPELKSYVEEPSEDFWKAFPKRDLPGVVTTREKSVCCEEENGKNRI